MNLKNCCLICLYQFVFKITICWWYFVVVLDKTFVDIELWYCAYIFCWIYLHYRSICLYLLWFCPYFCCYLYCYLQYYFQTNIWVVVSGVTHTQPKLISQFKTLYQLCINLIVGVKLFLSFSEVIDVICDKWITHL